MFRSQRPNTSDTVGGRARGPGRPAGDLPSCLLGRMTLVVVALGATTGLSGVLAQAPPPAPPAGLRIVADGASAPIGRGPQASLMCPAGAVDIAPGTSIQTMVNARAGNTTFCLKAGVHPITSAITPKTGNTFVGEYGAILDGAGWRTTVDYAGAFMAHNQDIDNVTIRNLVIRNMPQRGIHAFYLNSDRWTVENNEITGCRSGVSLPNASVLRRNYIHHNNGDSQGGLIPNGGYIATSITNSLFEDNEIAYNGGIQKVTMTSNVTFRNNHVHHNGNGIWYDGDNVGSLIEGNVVEDNGGNGIFYEISGQGVIRNNVVRRSGESAIFMSTSRDVEIYLNTLESNFRAVNLFVSCGNVHPARTPYPGAIGWDLRNNNVHHNTVVVGNQSGAIGNLLGYDGTCTAAQAEAYLNGSKNNVFAGNQYTVPSLTGPWWHWGAVKTWNEWRALGQDTNGTASQ